MQLAFYLVFLGLIGFGALSTVATVGKPRRPTTGGQAAAVVLVAAIQIIALTELYRH